MQVEPYLFFDGRCEEAIEFYKRAVSAKVEMMMRFKDSPDQGMTPPGSENKVMHARITLGNSAILASDGHCQGKQKFDGFSLSLTVANEAEASRAFTALSEGGKISQPLSKTFFSPSFGMLQDRFGVNWMVYVRPGV